MFWLAGLCVTCIEQLESHWKAILCIHLSICYSEIPWQVTRMKWIVRLIGDRLLIEVKYKVESRTSTNKEWKQKQHNKIWNNRHTFINLTTEWTENVYGMGFVGKAKWNKLANVLSWMSRRDGRDKGTEVLWSNWNHSFFIDYLESAIFVVVYLRWYVQKKGILYHKRI